MAQIINGTAPPNLFTTGGQAIPAIRSADPRLGELIDLIGEFTLVLRTDYFASLVRCIIGQQLSVRVAAAIWQRTVQACGHMTPAQILAQEDETMRAAGLSRQKIASVRDLAGKVSRGEVDLARLPGLSDAEIISTLTGVRGIGVWTAQIFLIFSLGRPDVTAAADLGLRRALQWLYRLDELPGAEEFARRAEKWRPYRTVASLYLWEAVNRNLLGSDLNKL